MSDDRPETPAKNRRREKRRAACRAADSQGSEPDYRALLDHAVQGIVVHRNFKPLYANQAFAALFGYESACDIMKLPLLRQLVPTDVWPRLESEYDDIMRGGKESLIGRSRALRADGSEFWVAVTIRAVDWPGGKAMMMTAFDISHQVEVEHNLLCNEQRLRAVMEILPYPIYIARREDGQILFVNRKSCLLFQRRAGQLLKGKSYDFYVDAAERDNLAALLDQIGDIRDIEVKMKTGEGRIFTAELAAIKLAYGGVPAVLIALNDVSQRKEMEAELFRQASTDALTGISNRRYFQTQAEQEMRRARRFSRDMSLMMIDIDHFKPINDSYGHAAGDAVLQGLVKRAQESLRQSDTLGRIGGEEFAVFLPETNLAAGLEVAERLRIHIEERPIVADARAVPCSVSIGIAQLSAHDGTIDDLMRRADRALYRAKNGGRNRVEVALPVDEAAAE
jgi:diguanylate cyclase (GGDEF)-like protein/PAS domain S-box-containing protein